MSTSKYLFFGSILIYSQSTMPFFAVFAIWWRDAFSINMFLTSFFFVMYLDILTNIGEQVRDRAKEIKDKAK